MALGGTYATFSSTTARRQDTCVGLEEEVVGLEEEVVGNTAAILKHRHLENKEPRLLSSSTYKIWLPGQSQIEIECYSIAYFERITEFEML